MNNDHSEPDGSEPDEPNEPDGGAIANPFRTEAIDHQNRPALEGRVLQLSPSWPRWTYWALLATSAATVIYALSARVPEWVSGPAIVETDDRIDAAADVAGTVASVEARTGAPVHAGDVLVHLRVEADLANDPAGALHTLRAPRDGLVSDIRVRVGDRLSIGEGAVTIVADDARFHFIALLPARHRALLRAGMPLRIELEGREGAQPQVEVESVGDEALTVRAAERLLGRYAAGLSQNSEPVVLVRASLPTKDRALSNYDGARGVAWVAVRSRTIAATLVPPLGAILDDDI